MNRSVDSTGEERTVDDGEGQPRKQPYDDFRHPAMTAPIPVIWIPEDPLGISKEEIRDTEAAGDIKITDQGAKLDENNNVVWTENPPDYRL